MGIEMQKSAEKSRALCTRADRRKTLTASGFHRYFLPTTDYKLCAFRHPSKAHTNVIGFLRPLTQVIRENVRNFYILLQFRGGFAVSAARNGHKEAFARWYARHETARKKLRISAGRRVPGFEAPPAGPEYVQELVDAVGERRAAELCTVHRTTVMRWLDGSVQIPPAALAILRFHAEGVPPGCGDAWRGFKWSGNTLTTPDGRATLSAHEIAGAAHLQAYQSALERRVHELESQLIEMARRVAWGSANDPYVRGGDVRAKAFAE